MKKEQIWNP